ncbi:MAG: 5-(carboxyamino)imidazole ribonucleotide synthase [Lactobacillaceae bacterium]|jgi:5-(carboxyamino)imidazole ribonucleotide synthase|nr:5-(carboxyamino)imidazole ribonucleotide synthase [Lactobacillaceae bacterium]
MTNAILPPATIGIVGGGQLGRMLALAAKTMGYRVVILDSTPDSPAGQVSDEQIIAEYNDTKALLQLAEVADVLTYEFENVDLQTLNEAGKIAALPQGTELLRLTKNRLREKTFLQAQGLPVANFAEVTGPDDLLAAVEKVGTPAILKTVEGGYDGHGQWDIPDVQTAEKLLTDATLPINLTLILEKKISFDRELSVMVTRDGNDEVRVWPTVENIHDNHILKTTFAPATVSVVLDEKIHEIASTIANQINLRGVLGIEMFVQGDQVYINELAPRPHNSGHYSIEGTNLSQFEGHIRSICGLPIPEIELREQTLMLNLLGTELTSARNDLIHQPNWHFHDYGKAEIKTARKMGHITALGAKNIQALQAWGTEHGES